MPAPPARTWQLRPQKEAAGLTALVRAASITNHDNQRHNVT